MVPLLHRLLPVTLAAIIGLFIAEPFLGQPPVTINSSAGQKKSIDEPDPLLLDSITDAELTRTDGTEFRLNDLKGKVVLVNLWATWLGPSREQIPELIQLQKKYGADRFIVIGINAGDGDGHAESPKAIGKYRKTFRINYPLVRAPDMATIDLFYKYTKFSALPLTLVLGADGTLKGVFRGSGPRVTINLRDTVEKLVNESEK